MVCSVGYDFDFVAKLDLMDVTWYFLRMLHSFTLNSKRFHWAQTYMSRDSWDSLF